MFYQTRYQIEFAQQGTTDWTPAPGTYGSALKASVAMRQTAKYYKHHQHRVVEKRGDVTVRTIDHANLQI